MYAVGRDTTKKGNEPGFFDKLFHRSSSKKDDKKPDNGGKPLTPPSGADQTPKGPQTPQAPQVPSQSGGKQGASEAEKKTTSEMKDEARKQSVKEQRNKEQALAYQTAERIRLMKGQKGDAAKKLSPEEEKKAAETAAKKQEINQKKTEFDSNRTKINESLNAILINSNQLLKGEYSHRRSEKLLLAQQYENMRDVNRRIEQASTYTILNEDQSFGYDLKLKEMQLKQEATQKTIDAADEKIQKYSLIRNEFAEETGNERLMRFIRKVAGLENRPAPDPNAQQSNQPKAPLSPEEAKRKGLTDETIKEQVEEFYGEYGDAWGTAAEDITDVVLNHFDTTNLGDAGFGSAADKADVGLSGIFSFFGAIKATFSAWNTFSRMYKNDKLRKMRGEKKDAHDIWQDVRVGLEKVVDIINSTLGFVGSFLKEGPAAILGLASNAATLLLKFVTIADSSARAGGILYRKQKLWNQMEEKKAKHKDELMLVQALDFSGFGTRAHVIKKKREWLRDYLSNNVKLGSTDQKVAVKQQFAADDKKKKRLSEKVHYGDDYVNLSDKLDAEKAWGKQQNFTFAQEKEYKKRVHLMEALELIERYYEEDAAHNRHLKMIGHAVEDSITESVDMIGNLGDLSVIGGSWGKILNIAAGAYKVVRGIGSEVYKHVSKVNGHNDAKKFLRTEMSDTMFQSIKGITTPEYGWIPAAGSFNPDFMPDFRLKSANERVKHIHGMMNGLDLHMNPLLETSDREGFVENLASAFSQDGNG